MYQLRRQRGPAGLMAGAHARAGVAVKVFVERHVVAPARIGLEERLAAEDRPATAILLIAQEDARQPAAQRVGGLVQSYLRT